MQKIDGFIGNEMLVLAAGRFSRACINEEPDDFKFPHQQGKLFRFNR